MSFRELVPGAIYDEDVETLRSVLASGVDLNQPIDGVTALCLAARLGRLSIVKYLAESAQVNFVKRCTFKHSSSPALLAVVILIEGKNETLNCCIQTSNHFQTSKLVSMESYVVQFVKNPCTDHVERKVPSV